MCKCIGCIDLEVGLGGSDYYPVSLNRGIWCSEKWRACDLCCTTLDTCGVHANSMTRSCRLPLCSGDGFVYKKAEHSLTCESATRRVGFDPNDCAVKLSELQMSPAISPNGAEGMLLQYAASCC